MKNIQIQEFTKIISDESRVSMCNLLMSGEFYTVNELARVAKIKPHTASYHLKKMLLLDLLTMEKHGRFHYYKLAKPEFIEFFETLGIIEEFPKARYLSEKIEAEKLMYARTCYDHLAGKLGVEITQLFLNKNFIKSVNNEYELTELGENFLKKNDINVEYLRTKKRVFCGKCLDWSERKHHISGSIGNAIYKLFLESNWIVKSNKSRAVILSDIGKNYLKNNWDLTVDD